MTSVAAAIRRCFGGRRHRTPDQPPPLPPVNTKPTAPTSLVATNQTQTSLTIRWGLSESTDGLDIAGYKVFLNDELIALQASNVAVANGLTAGTEYTFYVIGYTEELDSDASADLVVSTLASDLTPDPFPFPSKAGVDLSTTTSSDYVPVTGINGPAYAYVENGLWSKNGSGIYTAANGTVSNNETVSVQHESSGSVNTSVNTTLYIGGVPSTFTSTTSPADAIPNDFGFNNVSGVGFGLPTSSDAVPITGINVPVPISVVAGTYRLNGGVPTSAPGTVSNGQTVTLGHTSSSQPLTPTTTVVTIAGIDRSFTSTTKADTQAPSVPFQNPPINVGLDGFTVNWQASTDDVEVGGYVIYANGVYKGYTTGALTFPVSGYPPSTSVTFVVRSFDPSGNVSAASNPRTGTTPADPALNNRSLAGALQVVAVRASGNISIATGSPNITGAVIGGSNMTITGTGFGTKATAAPTYFKSWNGVAPGTLATNPSVGLDRYHTDNPQPSMSSYAGIGGNSLYVPHPIPAGADEGYSMHLQKIVPDCTELLMSHWMRITCSNPSILTGTVQIKGHRVGIGTSTDASANYGNINPRMGWTSWRRPTTLAFPTIAQDNKPEYWGTAANGSAHPATGYDQRNNFTDMAYGAWLYTESHFKWNDLGDNNGFIRMSYNNKVCIDTLLKGVTIDIRSSAGHVIRNAQLHPGIQSINATGTNPSFDVWYSRPFIDTGADCQARVFLGNASTLANCTGRFMVPATSWSGTSIAVSDCVDIPTGYDWVYVVKADGTISNGFKYT